jgi:hypothetical protein
MITKAKLYGPFRTRSSRRNIGTMRSRIKSISGGKDAPEFSYEEKPDCPPNRPDIFTINPWSDRREKYCEEHTYFAMHRTSRPQETCGQPEG